MFHEVIYISIILRKLVYCAFFANLLSINRVYYLHFHHYCFLTLHCIFNFHLLFNLINQSLYLLNLIIGWRVNPIWVHWIELQLEVLQNSHLENDVRNYTGRLIIKDCRDIRWVFWFLIYFQFNSFTFTALNTISKALSSKALKLNTFAPVGRAPYIAAPNG
jgi:hypothetical protein